jgi:hypothetical protein
MPNLRLSGGLAPGFDTVRLSPQLAAEQLQFVACMSVACRPSATDAAGFVTFGEKTRAHRVRQRRHEECHSEQRANNRGGNAARAEPAAARVEAGPTTARTEVRRRRWRRGRNVVARVRAGCHHSKRPAIRWTLGAHLAGGRRLWRGGSRRRRLERVDRGLDDGGRRTRARLYRRTVARERPLVRDADPDGDPKARGRPEQF